MIGIADLVVTLVLCVLSALVLTICAWYLWWSTPGHNKGPTFREQEIFGDPYVNDPYVNDPYVNDGAHVPADHAHADHVENTEPTDSPATVQQRIAVCGLVRNNTKYLPAIFAKLREFEQHCTHKPVYVFYENDSRDDSVELLRGFLASHRRNGTLVTEKNVDKRHPRRTDRLAYGRTVLQQCTLQAGATDLVMMLDMDDVNEHLDVASVVATIHDADRWDVATANQRNYYYDKWALRTSHKHDNCWHKDRCSKYTMAAWIPDISKDPDKRYIHVQSAFGGLGLYKWKYWVVGTFDGRGRHCEEDCEHVRFFSSVRAKFPDTRVVIARSMYNN